MFGFYYTGADKFLASQPQSKLSLGNFIASSKIANGQLSNVFGAISETMLEKGVKEMRCIALKNEGVTNITQITLSVVKTADVISQFAGFFILPAEGDCQDFYFEKLTDPNSIPTSGTLITLEGGNIVVNLTLLPGEYLGLWLQRIIPGVTNTVPSLECPECDVLQAAFEAGDITEKEELYQFNFDYTEVTP